MLTNKNYKLRNHEEIRICYGERSNSFLLVEYGFAIKHNKYDYVRHKDITIKTFFPDSEMTDEQALKFEELLAELRLKDRLQADLKSTALHRDVLKLIRCFVKATNPKDQWHEIEQKVMLSYKTWIQHLQKSYPSTLEEDEALLTKVESDPSSYYWMYQFVLIYRIGQKQILSDNFLVSSIILKVLGECGGDRDIFEKELDYLRNSTSSMQDYFKYDL